MDSNILCVDTCKMFRDFFSKKQTNITPCPSDAMTMENLLNDEFNESLSAALDVVMAEEKGNEIQNVATTSAVQMLPYQNKYTKVIDSESIDSKHNSSGTHGNIDNRALKCKREDTEEKTPANKIIKLQNICAPKQPSKKNNNIRRKLNFNDRPINLKLRAIYEYMFESTFPHQHSAEADCLAMIRCVSQIADFFLKWSDDHAFPLVHCKKR